jgi:hypothetical protein
MQEEIDRLISWYKNEITKLVTDRHSNPVALARIEAYEEYIEQTLHSGPNENGFYQLKNWEDEILDVEEYTKEQIVELLKESKGYQAEIDDALRMINIFFPQCERGELNTGDY